MTEKANPSPSRPADAFATAGAIAYGGSIDGFIIDGESPTAISEQDADINEDALDTFSQSSSSSALTISITGGEGFVFGAWLAIDTTTTVTLDADSLGQTVYLGWNKNSSNDVIIGTDSAFATVPTDTDQRIPLYEFDTDASGVISVTDLRQIGKAETLTKLSVAESLGVPVYSDSTNAPSEIGSTILVDGVGSEPFGIYTYDGSQYIRASSDDEQIESVIASVVTGGNAISVEYSDSNDSLTINNTGAYTDADTRDAVATALTEGENISITYDEPNNDIIITTDALNQEQAEDVVGSLIVGGENVDVDYNDTTGTLLIALPDTFELTELLVTENIEIQSTQAFSSESGDNIEMENDGNGLLYTNTTTDTELSRIDETGNMSIAGELTEGNVL